MNHSAITTVDENEGRGPRADAVAVKVHPRVPFAFRFMPSVTDVAFLMPIVFLMLSPEGMPGMLEGDTGWHIRTGEWILKNHSVPYRDMFSFTKPGEPWFAWEWLWDVPAALLHAHGGLTAVILASLLIICFASALLFRLALRRSGSVFAAIAVSLVAIMASTMHWLARPHLVTFVFVIVFYWIIEDTRERGMKRLWLLLPLTALWTNLHGGFVAGLVLLGAYVAGESFGGLVSTCASERRARFRAACWYAAAAAGCLAASLVNPYGYKLHLHMVKYLNERAILEIVSEWQSISFRSVTGPYLEAFIVLALGAAIYKAARRDFVRCF